MPRLIVKKATDVPLPSRASRAVRELQQKYDEFVRGVELNEAGELELDLGDNIRSVKVRLRRASSRLGLDIDIWDANGKVYFRRVTRRGRQRRPA
jgi:hypothetical protein